MRIKSVNERIVLQGSQGEAIVLATWKELPEDEPSYVTMQIVHNMTEEAAPDALGQFSKRDILNLIKFLRKQADKMCFLMGDDV